MKSKFLKSAALAIAAVALTSSLSSCKMYCKHKEEASKEEKSKKRNHSSKEEKAGAKAEKANTPIKAPVKK